MDTVFNRGQVSLKLCSRESGHDGILSFFGLPGLFSSEIARRFDFAGVHHCGVVLCKAEDELM